MTNNYNSVHLSKEEMKPLEELALKIEQAKKSESGYINDGEGIYFRHIYGLYAERAVEKMFNINFIDYTVGNSSNYDHGDLTNAGCPHVGVKALLVNKNEEKFHKVSRAAIKCEILVFIEKAEDGGVVCYIPGIYTPDVLRNYNTRDGVDENITATKGNFYGISEYKKITNYNHIKYYNDAVPNWLEKNNIKTKTYA
jgi:hypothetical protein